MRQSYNAVEPSEKGGADVKEKQPPKSRGVAGYIAIGISVTVLIVLALCTPNPPKQLYVTKTETWAATERNQGIIISV